MTDDSIEGIYDTLKQCALISKSAGGIGLNVHNIRAKGSLIAGVSNYNVISIPSSLVYASNKCYKVKWIIRDNASIIF